MSDGSFLPKKRVRRGVDRDRDDERESLVDHHALNSHHSSSGSHSSMSVLSHAALSHVKKNPSRVIPDQYGRLESLSCCLLLCIIYIVIVGDSN